MNDENEAMRKRLQAINDAYLKDEDRDPYTIGPGVRPPPRQAIREEVSRDQAILNGDLSKLWEE